MEILVVARHVDDRGGSDLAADERHAELPIAVCDVAGQNQQIARFIGRELVAPGPA